jgi:hypothetical protein
LDASGSAAGVISIGGKFPATTETRRLIWFSLSRIRRRKYQKGFDISVTKAFRTE